MKNSTKRFAVGALLAGVAGYLAGILTAPKSGKETRDDIKNNANKLITDAEKELKDLHTQLTKNIDTAKKLISKVSGQAREQLEKNINKATVTKQKVREILSAIHEDGAEDEDLKAAITDARQAIKNLKSYLSK